MADRRQRTPIVGVESEEKKKNTHEVCPFNDVRTKHKTHMAHDTTTNKPTLLRLTVRHVAVFYDTLPRTQTLFVQ